MKKYSLVVILIGIIVLPLVTYASTVAFSLSPNNGTLTVGQSKTINLYIEPNMDSPVYTTKVEMNFPSDLLHVQSFTPALGTMSVVQPGYDLLDNTKGSLIKTIGFPGGVTSKTLIGSIVFSSVQAGVAEVGVSSSNSMAYNATNENIATVFGTAHFTIINIEGKKTEESIQVDKKEEAEKGVYTQPTTTTTEPTTSTTDIATSEKIASSSLAKIPSIAFSVWDEYKVRIIYLILGIISFILGLIIWRKSHRRSSKQTSNILDKS